MNKEQIAAVTLATTALLTAGCNSEREPQNHTPGVEATTPSPEQSSPVDNRVAKSIGVITINATKENTVKLDADRSEDIKQAVETLDSGTGHHFKFSIKDYDGVTVTPSPTDIRALKRPDLPVQERIAIEEGIIEQGLETARKAGAEIIGNDIMAISLEVPEPADKQEAHAYGENGGFNQSNSPAGVTAVRVNNASQKVIVHELAHALNDMQENKVMHSNTANCDAFLEVPGKSDKLPLIMTAKAAQTCAAIEYGDRSTVMGDVESKAPDIDPFNAIQLLQLEAIGAQQVKTISTAGAYEVPLDALSSAAVDSTKLIRINLPKGVPAPFVGADPSLNYAYCIEVSSNIKAQQLVKLMVAGFNSNGLPVGDTYAIPLNNLNYEDPGLPTGFKGQFFKDTRFGLSLAVAQPSQGSEPAIITVTRQN